MSLLVLISCSKDSDLLRDAVLSDTIATVDELDSETEDTGVEEEPLTEEVAADGLESRTTSFPAINDAHFQSGKGFNQSIIRLEEGNRTSYLMFDLSPIEAIAGEIEEAALQFTISSDDGNGSITVFKGASNDWTEEDLAETTVPGTGEELGSITKDYKIGATEAIALSSASLVKERNTLILDHSDGNDLAFASKEHSAKSGPQLVVTYKVPFEAEEIVPTEEGETEESTTGETIEDENDTEQEENAPAENEEPMAIADGTPTTGKAPLEVSFTGSNSSDDNEIKSYRWDFADGSNATQPNPKHTFTKVGSYEVTLTVEDDQGLKNTDTVIINVTDEANQAPVLVMSANPRTGTAPLEVSFDGSKSTDDNGISSYSWNFKDGNTANNVSPKHTFTESGTYDVELTIKDENGLTVKKDLTITVSAPANKKPVAVAAANRTSGEAPLSVQFTGNNSTDDKKVEKYAWNFKDGSNSAISNPSHTFDDPGTYAVVLTVTDAEGLTDSKTISIRVTEPAVTNAAPKAVATPNKTSGQAPLEVKFTGNKSTDDDQIVSYVWNFDDGSATSTQPNPTHTFQKAGTYRVSLTVTDTDGATHTDVDTITVTAPSNNNNGNTGGGSNGNYPPNAVMASSFGFKVGDATEAFQDALRSNHSFIVVDKQSSDWIIQPTRLFNVDNKTIIFEEGVVLRAKSGAFGKSNAVLLNFFESENLVIKGYGATLRMNKNEYGRSEFRHALLLDGCKNITIQGLTFRDSGGDGIMINTSQSRLYSENITIEDVVSTNNSRMALTIISAKDVWVRNSTFERSNGQAPEAGIGLEPDKASERLQNLNFINCKLQRNNGPGFYVGTNLMNSGSTPISVTLKNSEFSWNAQNKVYSYRPATELLLGHRSDGKNDVKGTVLFEGLQFNGARARVVFSQKPADAYKVTFRNCSATNVISEDISYPIHIEGILGANTLGGFDFGNFNIQYNINKSFMHVSLPNGFTLRDIQGNFRIKEPGNNPVRYSAHAKPNGGQNVNIQYTHIN